MDSNYSLSDIRAVTDGDGFGGGNNAWVLILLFAMIFGGGGFGFGNNRSGSAVTEADLCNANSFNDLKSSVRNVSDQIGSMYTGLQNGICNLGYTNLENFNAIVRQISDCCCTTKQEIGTVRFDMANYTAAINANTTAGIQKVLDKLCETETQNLRDRVNQLELQSAVCGVVRYPSASTYFAGTNPFCGGAVGYSGGCCTGNI